jgi:FkbM family methyltransferase
MIWLYFAKTYSFICGVSKRTFNINPRGLGFFLRRIKGNYIIKVNGKKMYLNHNVASCYERLINGAYNEPETHIFFEMLMDKTDYNIVFIDVGANVGEMILDFARYKKVTQVFGYEPHPQCATACELSVGLNNYGNVIMKKKALSDKASRIKFILDRKSPNISRFSFDEKEECTEVESSTLDTEFPDAIGPAVVLVDVEGGEPLVLRGGKNL